MKARGGGTGGAPPSVPPTTVLGALGGWGLEYELVYPHSLSVSVGPCVSLSLLALVLHFADEDNQGSGKSRGLRSQGSVECQSPGLLCG